MPSEKQALKDLEHDTIDTAVWAQEDSMAAEEALYMAESRMRGAAIPQIDGTLRSFHVTDDPRNVVEILQGRGEFVERKGDLCGGLYVSSEPHFWESRSRRQWEFMHKLTKQDLDKLIAAIREQIDEFVASGYITQSEYETANRILQQASEGYWPVLDIVANQPYNVNLQKLAKRLGLAKPFEPFHVPVDFVGRYLEFNTKRAIDAYMALLENKFKTTEGLTRPDLCNLLREYGWDGIFTKAGFGTNPELVIWNKDKILSFGDWIRQSGSTLGATENDALWLIDPESRFEAVVSGDKRRSIIFDRLLKQSFDFVSRRDVEELEKILEFIGAGEPIQAIGRFESRLLYQIPQIRDVQHDKYFRRLLPKDLDDLEHLVGKLLDTLI